MRFRSTTSIPSNFPSPPSSTPPSTHTITHRQLKIPQTPFSFTLPSINRSTTLTPHSSHLPQSSTSTSSPSSDRKRGDAIESVDLALMFWNGVGRVVMTWSRLAGREDGALKGVFKGVFKAVSGMMDEQICAALSGMSFLELPSRYGRKTPIQSHHLEVDPATRRFAQRESALKILLHATHFAILRLQSTYHRPCVAVTRLIQAKYPSGEVPIWSSCQRHGWNGRAAWCRAYGKGFASGEIERRGRYPAAVRRT